MKKAADAQYIPGIERLSGPDFKDKMLSEVRPQDIACANWKEYPYIPEVTLRIAFSDSHLALLYKVREEHIRGAELEDNGPVWEDSCVETFIKDPVGEGYYNIEVNCIGTRLVHTACQNGLRAVQS